MNNTTDDVALTDIGRDTNKLKSNERLLLFGSDRAPRSCLRVKSTAWQQEDGQNSQFGFDEMETGTRTKKQMPH